MSARSSPGRERASSGERQSLAFVDTNARNNSGTKNYRVSDAKRHEGVLRTLCIL